MYIRLITVTFRRIGLYEEGNSKERAPVAYNIMVRNNFLSVSLYILSLDDKVYFSNYSYFVYFFAIIPNFRTSAKL